MDYKSILKKIYQPEIGAIWKAPNKIWTNKFSKNIDQENFHPAIIEKVKNDGISIQLAPGTSKDYNKGSCVFKISLTEKSNKTFFLLKLSMPYLIDDLHNLDRGWDNIDILDEDQLKDFVWQIKICKG